MVQIPPLAVAPLHPLTGEEMGFQLVGHCWVSSPSDSKFVLRY